LKKYLLFTVLFSLCTPLEVFPQFDSIIFRKDFSLNWDYGTYRRSIHAAGDLNSDGYDDFLVYDCMEASTYIFYGGNPVDTIPKIKIEF